jgi:hypothetical protein
MTPITQAVERSSRRLPHINDVPGEPVLGKDARRNAPAGVWLTAACRDPAAAG